MSTAKQRSLGRPRDARADRAIVAATLELIAEAGVDGFRVDDVADRAGVGKAAIYRRHPSKDALVAAAIAAVVSDIEVPDTGSTREDLIELMREAVDVYADPVRSGVVASVVGAMRLHPELTRAVRDGFLTQRREALRAVLDRGIGRGDLASDLDVELALDALGGALFYRLLITGGPIDEHLAEGVAELILRGFASTKEKQS